MDQKIKDKLAQYKHVFLRTREGELVLQDLKDSLGYGQNVYVSGQNRDDTYFHLGRQSVINDIVNFINKEITDGNESGKSASKSNKSRKSKF